MKRGNRRESRISSSAKKAIKNRENTIRKSTRFTSAKTRKKSTRQLNTRKVSILVLIMILAVLIVIFGFNKKETIISNPEILTMMAYEQLEDSDFVTQSEYVNFGAFFLRDLDGDGYAEKIAGTCKEIGQKDTLYFNLAVNTEGVLKNGKITIDGKNFNLSTAIVKDSVIKQNYIATNTAEIELNDVYVGTSKLLMGIINCNGIDSRDDYTKINTVTLTGTYISSSGEEIEINKTIDLTVDWYGNLAAKIETSTLTLYKDDVINLDSNTLDLEFSITTKETKEQLLLTQNYLKGIIPELNGYKATSVSFVGNNIETTYNEETGEFTVIRTGEYIPRINAYTIKVKYPLEAYESLNEDVVSISIPVTTNYTGINNTGDEFESPITSDNVSKAVTLIIESFKPSKEDGVTKFSVTVGKKTSLVKSGYIVSSEIPLRIYKGEDVEENTEYTVLWKASLTETDYEKIEMSQTQDDTFYYAADGSQVSMNEYVRYKGIYFVNAGTTLGENGYIIVKDADTNTVLHTFTSADWLLYSSSNPYIYDSTVKNIKIETSAQVAKTNLFVYHIKEIDDDLLTTNYSLEEFENLTEITSYLTGVGTTSDDEIETTSSKHTASYDKTKSYAELNISQTTLSTQDIEANDIITITTKAEDYNAAKWIDGEFVVKFPKEILEVEVNSIETSSENIKILGYEIKEIDDGYYLRIVTDNNEPECYEIYIDVNLMADSRIATTENKVELYYSNANCENYFEEKKATDIYDVNTNLDVSEYVGYADVTLSLVTPGLLTTSQIASDYDDSGEITIAPQVAEIEPEVIVDKPDEDKQTATVTVQIMNNYTGTISETKILGQIPFEGNVDKTGKSLGSTYTTQMSSSGIQIPDNLKDVVTIYYSEVENPTKDLSDTSNGWTKVPSDFSKVKTFLIDFEDYILAVKEECNFSYEIEIPNNLNYNEISYSLHSVDFYLDTEDGKLGQKIEPRKLGFRIAKKYDLELTKYKKGTNTKVPGMTFSITTIDDNESITKIRTTDDTGILIMEELYVERVYELKEIKVLDGYELNEDTIRFIAHVDSSGTLNIEILSGNFLEVPVIEIPEEGLPKIKVSLDNEVKYDLELMKLDSETSEHIIGAKFTLTGNGTTKNLVTNSKGEISLQSLSIGKDYTLQEISVEGYYLLNDPIKFRVFRNSTGTLELETSSNCEATIIEEEGQLIPIVNLSITNEKIPTYSLEIVKQEPEISIDTSDGTTPLNKYIEGVQFELYSEDLDESVIYTTDKNGKVTITDLYEYVSGKYITGKYRLKEIYAPSGYAVNTNELIFKVQEGTDGNLDLIVESGQDLIADNNTEVSGVMFDSIGTEITTKEVSADSRKITLNIENEAVFQLTKVDKDTKEPLIGVKFAFYKVEYDEENNEVLSQVFDADGNIFGTLETIDGVESNIVYTDEYGRITGNIPEGYYKAVEIETAEGYLINDSEKTTYFGIGTSKPAEQIVEEKWSDTISGTNGTLTYNDMIQTNDGGYVISATIKGTATIYAENTIEGKDIEVKSSNTESAVLLKYNSENKVEWSRVIKQDGANGHARDMDINASGNILVACGILGSVTIPAEETIDNVERKITGVYWDTFVLEFNLEGLLINGVSIAGNRSESLDVIKATSDGGFIIVGDINGSAVTIPAEKTSNNVEIYIPYIGYDYDSVVIKYDKNYLIEWAHQINSTSRDTFTYVEEINQNEYMVFADSFGISYTIPAEETVDGNDIEITGGRNYVIVYNSHGLVKSCRVTNTNSAMEKTDDGFIVAGYWGKNTVFPAELMANNTEKTLTENFTGLLKLNSDNKIEWFSNNMSNSWYATTVKKIIQTQDGGFIVVGNFSSSMIIDGINTVSGDSITLTNSGGNDSIIVKWNSDGKVEWAQLIGGFANDAYIGISELVATDGTVSYSTVGNFGGVTDEVDNLLGASIVEYDSSGSIINTQSVYSLSRTILNVINTSDRGAISVGYYNGKLTIPLEKFSNRNDDLNLYTKGSNDTLFVKYNSEGKIEWINSIGIAGDEQFTAVEELDDCYILVGKVSGQMKISGDETVSGEEIIIAGHGAVVLKYSKDGKLISAFRYPGGSMNDVKKTDDGGYVVVGNALSAFTISALETSKGIEGISLTSGSVMIKYDKNDKVEWATHLEGSQRKVSYKNNEYASISADTHLMNSVTKVNGAGEIEFYKQFECTYGGNNVSGLMQTDDGGVIVVGWPTNFTFSSDETVSGEEITVTGQTYFIKFNAEGLVEFTKNIADTGSYTTFAGDIQETDDGGYIVAMAYYQNVKILAENTVDNKEINIDKNTAPSRNFILKFNKNHKVEWYKFVPEFQAYFQLDYANNMYTTVSNNAVTQFEAMILSPEVPPEQNIEVTNTKMSYKISTNVASHKEVDSSGNEIEIFGGSISGMDKSYYEQVKYKENSVKDIIITPDEGYQVSSITVNGVDFGFTLNEDGRTVLLSKFLEMTEDKEVIVTFEKVETSVLVHHYLWDETNGMTTTRVYDDEFIAGKVGEEYIASPKADLENYELVTNKDILGETSENPEEYYIPDNALGTFADTQTEVIYYYKEKTYTLTVHHYLEGTTDKLADDEITENLITGTDYETKKSANIDRKYKVVLVVGDETGTISENTEITYYYIDSSIDITANKVWQDTISLTRPDEITIAIIGTNLVTSEQVYYEEQILNKDNSWSYIWNDLYIDTESGEKINYKIVELSEPENYYLLGVEEKNNTFTITNRIKPIIPNTGGEGNKTIIMIGISSLVIGMILIRKNKVAVLKINKNSISKINKKMKNIIDIRNMRKIKNINNIRLSNRKRKTKKIPRISKKK